MEKLAKLPDDAFIFSGYISDEEGLVLIELESAMLTDVTGSLSLALMFEASDS